MLQALQQTIDLMKDTQLSESEISPTHSVEATPPPRSLQSESRGEPVELDGVRQEIGEGEGEVEEEEEEEGEEEKEEEEGGEEESSTEAKEEVKSKEEAAVNSESERYM